MPTVRLSLTFSILASLACLLILTWLLFSLLAFKTAERDLYAQKSDHARVLLATFVNQLPEQLPSFPEGMLPLDAPAALYAGKLADEASFQRLTLLDQAGKIIFTVGREGTDLYLPVSLPGTQAEETGMLPQHTGLIRTAQVIRNNAIIGRAGLILSLDDEQKRISRTRQLLLTYFVLDFILLLGLGAFILARIVVRPVNRLLSATEKITDGVYGHQVTVAGARELAQLADSFNAMSAALAQKQQELSDQLQQLEAMNQDLKLAREEAIRSEKLASVGLLAAGTAHEIGTPLASVMGYAELLGQELAGQPVQADYLRRLQEGCSRIDRIVRGLLEYARPKAASCEPFYLQALLQRTVELVQHQGMLKEVTIDLQATPGLPPVLLDPHQLQQVLLNLLLNAADAMPGGGRLEITVSAGVSGACQLLQVQDSGSGIAPEHLPRLFDPFFTTKEPGKGTGLGLAIAARIIEGFGGTITATSTVGKGSCFSLRLPLHGKGCTPQ